MMLAMLALVGIGLATAHQAVVPYAPGSAIVTEIYSNDGTTAVTFVTIEAVCDDTLPNDTTMIEVVMGQVRDFFRPIAGRTVCEMLRSTDSHEFYNGTMWVIPQYYGSDDLREIHLGGSCGYWPLNNVDGDRRTHLSIWGRSVQRGSTIGGCCTSSYADEGTNWGQQFTINAITMLTPSSTPSPTPCANIYTDPSYVDELPAPICTDVLARDECEISAIRARCNFTCTGCTTAPVIPPTRAPTLYATSFADLESAGSTPCPNSCLSIVVEGQIIFPQAITVHCNVSFICNFPSSCEFKSLGNSRHFAVAENALLRLTGIILHGGFVANERVDWSGANGGGSVLIQPGGSASIIDCMFHNNSVRGTAPTSTGPNPCGCGGRGGAISAVEVARLEAFGTLFTNNHVFNHARCNCNGHCNSHGGAMWLGRNLETNQFTRYMLSNNTFYGNTATKQGMPCLGQSVALHLGNFAAGGNCYAAGGVRCVDWTGIQPSALQSTVLPEITFTRCNIEPALPTPCADIHADSFVDELPAPICADMLA